MIRFPAPLRPGDTIAITAPSSGVAAPDHARLDRVLAHLRDQGFRVLEGQCLRAQHRDASAPKAMRAAELMRFLADPDIAAIFPPWGGELASELLEALDFEGLRTAKPKWLLGFSDLSTLQLPLTLITGWATAHGPNLMDLAPTQTDPLTRGVMSVLARAGREIVEQASSTAYQIHWTPFSEQPDAALNLTEQTRWQRLDGLSAPVSLQGRLIGGCLDTIAWLAGSRYGDVPGFVARAGDDGCILYLENCEMNPPGLVRALLSLRRQRWFDGLRGVLIGRNTGTVPDPARDPDRLSDHDALRAVLGDLPCPVLFDVDIGHRQPQFTLINGAIAQVWFADGGGGVRVLPDTRA